MAKAKKTTTKKSKAKKQKQKKQKVVEQVQQDELVIPCKLYRSTEFEGLITNYNPDDVRCGRYHGSIFHGIKGFGLKKWVVLVRIMVNYDKYRLEDYTDEEIVTGCIRHLNQPPPRKKFQRRIKKPIYGTLNLEPVDFEMKRHNGEPCIVATLVTNERRNKNFFGEGLTGGIAGIGAKIPKLGRPRKEDKKSD